MRLYESGADVDAIVASQTAPVKKGFLNSVMSRPHLRHCTTLRHKTSASRYIKWTNQRLF
jgi:hypothetical protein